MNEAEKWRIYAAMMRCGAMILVTTTGYPVLVWLVFTWWQLGCFVKPKKKKNERGGVLEYNVYYSITTTRTLSKLPHNGWKALLLLVLLLKHWADLSGRSHHQGKKNQLTKLQRTHFLFAVKKRTYYILKTDWCSLSLRNFSAYLTEFWWFWFWCFIVKH